MAERWLCKRCFTSADPIESACPNCGLPRGAAAPLLAGEVPEPEETQPGEEASQLPEGDSPPDKAPTTPAPVVPLPSASIIPGQPTDALSAGIQMGPNFECGRCKASIYQQWWNARRSGYECHACGTLNLAPGRTPSDLHALVEAGLVRTYTGPSRDRASQAFRADAAVQAAAGYIPISETWQGGEFAESGLFEIATSLMVPRGGTLTVTYGLNPATATRTAARGLVPLRSASRWLRGAIIALVAGFVSFTSDAQVLGWGLIGLGGILLLVEVVRRMNRPADDG
jgi:hypothetical protein